MCICVLLTEKSGSNVSKGLFFNLRSINSEPKLVLKKNSFSSGFKMCVPSNLKNFELMHDGPTCFLG